MNFFRKLGFGNSLMIALCIAIIIVAEYVFLNGDQLHGLFIGLWAPTLLGILILVNLVDNGSK